MSVLLYISTFIVGIICGVITQADMSSLENVPDSFWYVGMVAAVILTAIFAKLYFRSPKVTPSATSGLLFGLTAVVISGVLDFILFSAGGQMDQLGTYYGDYRFWIIVGLVIATAKIVGYMKRAKPTV